MMKETQIPSLHVEFRIEEQTLFLEYKVKNNLEKPIYLFNVLWDFNLKGDYIPAPSPVYSCLRSDGTLHLAKQILPLPKDRTVELRIIPFAQKVEAGHELSEKISLPIPIAEYNPYYPLEPDSKTVEKFADSIFFSLQFIEHSAQLEVANSSLPNSVRIDHPNIFAEVRTLASKPKSVQIKVSKRAAAFGEF